MKNQYQLKLVVLIVFFYELSKICHKKLNTIRDDLMDYAQQDF